MHKTDSETKLQIAQNAQSLEIARLCTQMLTGFFNKRSEILLLIDKKP